MRKNIIIIVPIYKEWLDVTEKISLDQLFKVLGHYDISFIAPQKLKNYCKKNGFNATYFCNEYFCNTSSYSHLLLSDDFYRCFAEYEYMLIYQLDAYVFYDSLKEMCALGYDYIGAPIPFGVREWREIKARVGNGGLSLRRISSVRRVLKYLPQICLETNKKQYFYAAEDMFFGYCGQRADLDFNVPDIKTALRFAVDSNVQHIYQKIENGSARLPFGCHAWNINIKFQFWKSYIDIDKIQAKEIENVRKNSLTYRQWQWLRVIDYIIHRYMQYNQEKLKRICQSFFTNEKGYVIWGLGKYGKMLYSVLHSNDIILKYVMDKNGCGQKIGNQTIEYPNFEKIEQSICPIIIGTIDYENSIRQFLIDKGCSEERIICCNDFFNVLIASYHSTQYN